MGMHQKSHTSSYNQHGGQILFRPTDEYDGYLYLVAGHGGESNLSENSTSYHGKLIRFDVDTSTPQKPEIFAVGLDDPRGCSFNPKRPSNLYCANVDQVRTYYFMHANVFVILFHGHHFSCRRMIYLNLHEKKTEFSCERVQQQYQRVYSISNLTRTYGGSTPNIFSHVVIDHGRPTAGSAPSIVGGPFYRGLADPSMNGKYAHNPSIMYSC